MFKAQDILPYEFVQANPPEGDWNELIRWISDEFRKVEEYAQRTNRVGYGQILLETDLALSVTGTPQLIAPFDIGSPSVAMITDAANGALIADKDGYGVWNVLLRLNADVGKNAVYTIHLYVNDVDVRQQELDVSGNAEQISITAQFFTPLDTGDKLQIYISSSPSRSATIYDAIFSAYRIG